MFQKSIQTIACLTMLMLSSMQGAMANYTSAEEKEVFWILSDDWKIVERAPVKVGLTPAEKAANTEVGYSINVQYGKKPHNFPVDVFLLARNVNSDSIAAGRYKSAMQDYIRSLKTFQNEDVLLKLSSPRVNGPLSLTGIWPFNADNAWNKALIQGSQIMNLSAGEVKRFGSANAYKDELISRTKSKWAQIESRKSH